ncbi:MAG: aminopeptidase P N-terminal domain-containing protein [Cytophagales bacterium]|nr:aminopeptidase P N-terminal domain-containing protein [Cytophagales bacterium]MDW8384043.1 aminopeptidase P N-terminal domain-containing protein [Flammeovirgaceae bacterium]
MRYEPIPTELFISNRKKLAQKLLPQSLAVLNSNDIYPKSADGTMRFVQHTDIFYLTGIEQEETVLLLFPDHPEAHMREILVIRKTNPTIAQWEGEKLTAEKASQISGVQHVIFEDAFEKTLRELAFSAKRIYLNTNEHIRNTNQVPTRDDRFIQYCKQNFPLHQYERLAPLLHQIRVVKEKIEIELIKKNIQITKEALLRAASILKPSLKEYELEAEIIYTYIKHGASGHAFDPIIASGRNACILHYIENNQVCQNGDLVLIDTGCCYAHYNADLTRVFPVSGTFTERQKQVYNAVLKTQRFAMSLLRPNVLITEYQKEVEKFIQYQLVELGLIPKHEIQPTQIHPKVKHYFMHGVSHFLGLDVHDYGFRCEPLQANTVLTCEPGIYIAEEGLGIRLENDVIITEGGCMDLSADVPIEIEEIEDIMKKNKGLF